MRQTNEISLIAFLTALSTGRVRGPIPARLHREATRALRGRTSDAASTVEDVVGAFLLSVLEERAKGRVTDWAALGERGTAAAVRRRVRQLACEQSEDWDSYRALRSHVRDALARGLPMPPEEAPSTLCEGDRLSSGLVAAAAAHAVARDGVPATVDALTAALRSRLHTRTWPAANDAGTEERLDSSSEDLRLDEHLEARRLSHALVSSLGERDARLYGRRLAGWGLKEVGAAAGLGTTSAFDRTHKAETTTRALIEESGCSAMVARAALKDLVAAAA